MFPKTGQSSVGQGIIAICLVFLVQRNKRIVAVGFFYPLHAITRIVQYLLTSLLEAFVLATGIVGILRILFVEIVVVVDEVDRAQRTILVNLSHHTTDTITVVRVVFLVKSYSIITHSNQTIVFRHIKPYPLVHHRIQILGLVRTSFLGKSVGYPIDGKQGLRSCPTITVFGSHQKRLGRRYMFVLWIRQIVHIEFPVPISQHRLVVIGPSVTVFRGRIFTVGPHHLNGMHSHHG